MNDRHKLDTADQEGAWKPTPIEVRHPERVNPNDVWLFRAPAWKLRLTLESDRSYLQVKIVRAAPLTHPDGYICFLDAKDEMIFMVDRIDELPEASRPLVLEELQTRYLTARVEKVHAVQTDYGVSYWDVETDRGRREFVVRDVAEHAQWLGEHRLIVVDVDGNRFEFPDLSVLDRKSLASIDLAL